MLSKDVTDLLSIEYQGLFADQEHCLMVLAEKRGSGDAALPPELIEIPLLDLSSELFTWIAQEHLESGNGLLIAKDVMSNISVAGLDGTYGQIVDMLADAGH